MSLASNIARRAGSAAYYARIAIPSDLQAHYPRTPKGEMKRELWQSLRTKDAREARARVHAVLDRWHGEFTALRRRLAAVEPTPAELGAETWQHYQAETEHQLSERRLLPTSAEIEKAKDEALSTIRAKRVIDPIAQLDAAADALVLAGKADLNRDFRTRRKAELERHVAIGETALVADVAREIIARRNFAIVEGTAAWRDLCHHLIRAELEGLRRAEEHDRGDYTGRVRDPIVKPPAGQAAPVAAPGESILELFETFANENPKRIRPDTIRVNRQVIGLFVEFVGATVPLSTVTKKMVSSWKSELRRYPIRASDTGVFRGMGFKRIIAENAAIGRPTLSDKSVNRYLSALGGFCSWAVKNGHIETNPVTGILIDKDRDAPQKVRPFLTDQLIAIFTSPLFTGFLSDRREHKPGNVRCRDHRYWLPLVSLFSGARLGEIAQLLVSDIRKEDERWMFVITREGDARKALKTKSAQRIIPVHPELERLGFLDFRAEREASGSGQLFPEIEPDARGQLSGNYSRFYGRYMQRIGVKTDASINFHSFRHGFIDALRRAGFRKEEYKCIVGHSKGDTTDNYGELQDTSLKDRVGMIDAVDFPELDLSNLYRACRITA